MKAAHPLLDWSQADLSAASAYGITGIAHRGTAKGFLEGRGKAPGAIRAAWERAGVTFTTGLESGDFLKSRY